MKGASRATGRRVVRNAKHGSVRPPSAHEVVVGLFDATLKADVANDAECEHEFGALGAASGDYCIHCGATSPG